MSLLFCWNCGCSCCYCKEKRFKDQVAIVTGSNQGIGFYAAKALLCKGFRVVIACRSKEKGLQAEKELSKYGEVQFIPCDLASLDSVRSFVEQFKELGIPLHVLLNNAGVMGAPYAKTVDGYETHIAVNHLGHFLLTLLLLDVLKKSAPSRIVNVASNAHLLAGRLPFDRMPDFNNGVQYEPMNTYSYSKQCNILFTYELQKRLEGTGVSAVVVHPGVIRSNLWQFMNPHNFCICKCPTDGAEPLIHGATAKSLKRMPTAPPTAITMENNTSSSHPRRRGEDRFLVPTFCCTTEATSSKDTYRRADQRQLWDLSVQWTGLSEHPAVKDLQISEDSTEKADFEPSFFQGVYAMVGMCPCCWCCF
eukprot:TRINITY_DN9295_c0_g1_i1.p1 TRINITY_DN9295_c0_g1~~TRINITY_DN9295_c0_g1_i1.p1  ORF type:complete len:363 (+),score=45.40 TRINITY_DN9295_c0_g1_i1:97-1185(+)